MADVNAPFGVPQTEPDVVSTLLEKIAALEALLATKAEADRIPPGEGTDIDSQGFPKKYVRLEVFRGQNPSDLEYVPVGVNGFVFKINRGAEVIVPSVVVEALNHAVEEITTKSEGGLETRPSHRFPWTVKGEATEAQYLAFRAQMRQMGNTASMQT